MSTASIPSNPHPRRTPGLLHGPHCPLDRPADAGPDLWTGPVPIGEDRGYCTVVHPNRLLPEVVQDDADPLSLRWTACLGRA